MTHDFLKGKVASALLLKKNTARCTQPTIHLAGSLRHQRRSPAVSACCLSRNGRCSPSKTVPQRASPATKQRSERCTVGQHTPTQGNEHRGSLCHSLALAGLAVAPDDLSRPQFSVFLTHSPSHFHAFAECAHLISDAAAKQSKVFHHGVATHHLKGCLQRPGADVRPHHRHLFLE